MSDDTTLLIEDLRVSVDDKEILHGLNLKVDPGKVHALMGPNGSGKSTLAYALAGHPRYKITSGSATFKGHDVFSLTPDERAKLGMFLAMQYPVEVPGVSVTNFLRTAVNAVRGEDVPVRQFAKDLREQMKLLHMDPKFAEPDSGLDIDALKVVSEGVNRLRGPELGVLLITHYTRILRYIAPDHVHVMVAGRIVESGGPELADELEEHGYERWRANGGSDSEDEVA